MNGMAFIFILVMCGIVSHVTVTSDYLSPSLANYARLLLTMDAGDKKDLQMTLAAFIIGQLGIWTCFFGFGPPAAFPHGRVHRVYNAAVARSVMASCPMQKHKERSKKAWFLAGLAGACAISGSATLFSSDGVAFKVAAPKATPGRGEPDPHSCA